MANKPNQTGMISRQTAQTVAKTDTSVKGYLKRYTEEIGKALPSQVGPERFQRICMTALTQNSELAKCTPASFIGAVLTAAQLGLDPNTPLGHAYLIPYGGKCTFQIGYRGMIELARRSGEIAMIKAHSVHKNDFFRYTLGLNPTLEHEPAEGDRGPVVAYYAFYKTKDGDFDFEVMTKAEVEQHRATYSKARKSPWNTEFDAMAKKTVLKKVLKYAPLSTEIMRRMATDESVKTFNPAAEDDSMKDLTLMPNDMAIDAEFEEADEDSQADVDPQTGEVKEEASA